MTSPTLIIGSILIAYSPTFSLLLLLISSKPQLLILAICAAFAYLLSALASSLAWLIITKLSIIGSSTNSTSSIGTVLTLSVTGVTCQMVLRCLFIYGYFNIETVIRRSVCKHEEEEVHAANNNNAEAAAGHYTSTINNGSNNNTATDGTTTTTTTASGATTNSGSNDEHPPTNNDTSTTSTTVVSETEALQLQLNDLSCSLASGVGYAILHSLFLYGTLLASEAGESNSSYNDAGSYVGGGGSTGYGGTLYQNSCTYIPSVLHGAIIAMCFSILDVAWMMLSFYGMRRIIVIILQQQHNNGTNNNNHHHRSFPSRTRRGGRGGREVGRILLQTLTCQGFDNNDIDNSSTSSSSNGGYTALLFVTITHLLASLVLTFNSYTNGCVISLPCLAGVVLWVITVLGNIVRKNQFLPVDQQSRIMTMRQQHVNDGGSSSSNENGMINGRSFI